MVKRFVFKPNQWFTERTFDTNFAPLPECSGVYLIVRRDFRKLPVGKTKYKVLYVGSSKNLQQRCAKHKIADLINGDLPPMVDAVFFFLPCANYIEEEKRLIKQIQARYNKQWR